MKQKKKRRSTFGIAVRVLLWSVGLAGVMIAAAAAAVALIGMPTYEVPTVEFEAEPTPKRVARGKRLVGMLCRRCHYNYDTDRLSGREMVEVAAGLGEFRAPNITRNKTVGIGDWTPSELALLLRTGLHPRRESVIPPPAMPRWPRMSDEDLRAIVAFLQSDDPWVEPHAAEPDDTKYSLVAKTKAILGWSPLPYPRQPVVAPSPDDLEAYGAYLVDDVLMCSTCHGDQWGEQSGTSRRGGPGYLGGGASASDVNGVALFAANLTPHATGIRDWTNEMLARVLVDGFGPDDKIVRWPTHRLPKLSAIELDALHAYLQTVAPVSNEVEASPPYKMVGRKAAGGRHLYTRYGCQYCHGHAGQEPGEGLVDLRGLDTRLPTDKELREVIDNPSRRDPYSPMPAFGGVIAEDEYDELLEYVRELGRRPAPAEP